MKNLENVLCNRSTRDDFVSLMKAISASGEGEGEGREGECY